MRKNSKNIEASDNTFFLSKNGFIIAIQVIATSITIFLINRLELLPLKFFIITVIIIALILLIISTSIIKSKGKLNFLFKVVSLLVSLGLVMSSGYALRGGDLLNQVTGANIDTHIISIIVKKDSKYNSLDDIRNETLGVNTYIDKSNIEKGVGIYKEELDYEPILEEYTDYSILNGDLMDGKIEGILFSESHRGLMKELNNSFDEDTRVISFVKYDVDNNIKFKNTDVTNDTFSVYVTGIDTYGPVTSVSRSDVNMIVTVNPKTNQILLTSIPRDYHVELGTINEMDKLTHAGIFGVNESISTLEKLMNIEIDFYTKVNFSSVEQIVDAFGGVNVDSKYEFRTVSSPYVSINVGDNYLNGQEALSFVRERKNLPDGDNGRVRNQQELIKGLIKKASSPTILTNFDSVISSVGNSIQVSMSDSELKSLIRYQLNSNPSWDIQQYQLTGYGETSSSTYSMPGWDLYVMTPNYDSVVKGTGYIKEMEKGNIISIES